MDWKPYIRATRWIDELFFGLSFCYSLQLNDTYNIALHLGYFVIEAGVRCEVKSVTTTNEGQPQ